MGWSISRRQQGNVALGLGENVEMLVVGGEALEHGFSLVGGLRGQQTEVLEDRHLAAEDVAERRTRRLSAHGWNEVAPG